MQPDEPTAPAPVEQAAPVEAAPVVPEATPATAQPAQSKPRPVPSIGRIVHYKLSQGRNAGQYRPAMIVRVFDAEFEGGQVTPDSLVQLQVFTDVNNDELPATIWATSVHLGGGNGEYMWPPYVAPTAS